MTKLLGPSSDPEKGPGGSPTRKHEWTLAHSYLALMGGFEIVIDGADENTAAFPTMTNGEPRTTFTLSPDGFRLLAESHPDLIPDISLRKIQDKSKGSNFAKTLVCFQGACLPRYLTYLPSLLVHLPRVGS